MCQQFGLPKRRAKIFSMNKVDLSLNTLKSSKEIKKRLLNIETYV